MFCVSLRRRARHCSATIRTLVTQPTLPIVDVAALVDPNASDEAVSSASAAMGRAVSEHGFLYIKNHGVPKQVVDAMFSEARHFFLELPEPAKRELDLVRVNNGFRGYTALREETTAGQADVHECFDLAVEHPPSHPEVLAGRPHFGANPWPRSAAAPNFRPAMEAYTDAMQPLGHSLMRGLGLSLGLQGSHALHTTPHRPRA
jgi:isopenicillin N synthase-like dioxygenase